MPRRPEKVPKRLSATAMAHRSVAQYGQYSAPMYRISGLPPDIRVVPEPPEPPEMDVTAFETVLPGPIAFSVAAGTAVMSLITLAGSAAPVAEVPEPVLAEFWLALMTMKATTTTMTARMLPPVMKIRLRISAFRAAARCAAIFSRAFSRLILVALLIACPMNGRGRSPARVHRRALHLVKLPRYRVGAGELIRSPQPRQRSGPAR